MQFFQQVTRSCVGAVVNLRTSRQKNQFPLLKNATAPVRGHSCLTFLSAATPECTKALRISLTVFRSTLLRTRMSEKNVRAPVTCFAMPSYPVLETTSPFEKGTGDTPRHAR